MISSVRISPSDAKRISVIDVREREGYLSEELSEGIHESGVPLMHEFGQRSRLL